MADEQKGALAEGVTGSAEAATDSAPAATTDAAQTQESAEDRIARLEKSVEDERKLRLQHEQKARDARQALEEAQRQTTPTTGAGDPVRQRYDELQAELQVAENVLREFPNDFATLRAKKAVQRDLQELAQGVQAQQVNTWLKNQKDAIAASGEPEAIQQRATALVENNGVEASIALTAALGERTKQTETQRQQADQVAAAAMRGKPNTSASGTGSSAAKPRMTNASYLQRVNAGEWKLIQQRSNGDVIVEG